MKKNVIGIMVLGILFFSLQSCGDDEPTTGNFDLQISGLEDLGTTQQYEGWFIVDGAPVSTGVFSVDGNGALSRTSFEVDKLDLDNAATFVLTIEPNPDPSPDPSSVHILAGDISGNTANLNVSHAAALGNDFQDVSGKYILATPTNDLDADENSGIWFLDLSSGSPSTGLNLPTLPEGWLYEGWAVINGQAVSTGTFKTANEADSHASFSGVNSGPPFPGEDFLNNAPSGLNFPTDLSGGTAVISIEPFPDNSANPFTLKPLVGGIPQNAQDHFVYGMDQNLSFPTGSVTIK